MQTASLLRDVVRDYVRAQRHTAQCGDAASTVECHILTELVRLETCTQQELADRLMLDKGWISRAVDRLAAAGLVTRAPDPADRRRVQLRLSAAGAGRAADLDRRLDGHAQTLLAGFTPEQEAQFAALLSGVLANLRGHGASTACAPAWRPAQPSDWPAIAILLRDAGLPDADAAAHLPRFTVATDADGLSAAGGFEQYGGDALLRSVVVAGRARGRGLGTALLGRVLRDARARGVRTVYLLTEGADAFFARHGFRPMDRSTAPPAIRRTREFAGLCPASAHLMMLSLDNFAFPPC